MKEPDQDELHLERCKELIERQLGWGSGGNWSTQDYESLAEKIHEKTGVHLSIVTLKRLWGKIKYDSKPTSTTLNALAQFVGFENWRSFIQSTSEKVPVESQPVPPANKLWRRGFVALGIVGLAFAGYVMIQARSKAPTLDKSRFSFSSKKVVDVGVPNTVIFDYDASAANKNDSVFVQQSWDKRLSRRVDKDQKQHASIYYYPGFFEAKLVINDHIVKEHNLLIKTEGWLPLIEQSKVPVYFREEEASSAGVMRLPVEAIMQSNINLQPVPPWVAYYNVREFPGVMSDAFTFETRLKNEYSAGSSACQFAEIRIQFEGPAVVIPLSAKGCVSELAFGGTDGAKRDFSNFGCDFSDYVTVVCRVRNNVGEIFIGGNSAIRFKMTGDPEKLVGLGFRFQGTGSVDQIRISNKEDRLVYSEDFNQSPKI